MSKSKKQKPTSIQNELFSTEQSMDKAVSKTVFHVESNHANNLTGNSRLGMSSDDYTIEQFSEYIKSLKPNL